MLKIDAINQFYGQSHTLWDLSLELQQGECLCLMGRNCCWWTSRWRV